MVFDLINPSDRITFESESLEAAALAVMLLGDGKLGADCVDDPDIRVPLMLFGDPGDWTKAKFGKSLDQFVKDNMGGVAPVLRSFITGSPADRKLYGDALGLISDESDRAEFIRRWDDRKRSSMNAITNAAHAMADELEAKDGVSHA